MSTGVFRENIDYIVKVPLTDGQKLAAAEEMAEAYDNKVTFEARKKAQADLFKDLIEGEEARIKRNGNLLRKGHIETEMECESIKNYGENTVTIRRLDNGEIVNQRELNEDEQQMDMPADAEPEDGELESDNASDHDEPDSPWVRAVVEAPEDPEDVPDPPDTSANWTGTTQLGDDPVNTDSELPDEVTQP